MENFDKQPMVVVVSESLDPRIKRQLSAQLSSVVMNVKEVDAEIQQQASLAGIKQQADAESDKSEFDDNAKPETQPEPIENNTNQNKENENQETNNTDTTTQNTDDGQDQNNGDDPTFSDDGDDTFNGDNNNNSDSGQQPNNQAKPEDNSGNDNNQHQTVDNNQNNNNSNANDNNQAKEEPMAGSNKDGEDDVFNDPTFESVYSFVPKKEDAEDSVEPPPMKRLLYIRGTDRGVDDRTNIIISTIEDPENTVVIVDLSDVGEVQAKMEFGNCKKQMQEKNIMVFDTVDEATDYLNDVFEQLN